jgi:hypothetical protein
MIYTTAERNNAIWLIANGKADFSDVAFYERLETFNWITIKKLDGIINSVELTYAGKDLFHRLLKQNKK